MSQISKLYHHIKEHIESVRKIPKFGTIDKLSTDLVINRTCLILSLESYLSTYREKHSSIFIPLNGKDALIHLVVNKYKWPISEVRAMSLNDMLLSISDELQYDNLTEDCQAYLTSIEYSKYLCQFDDILEEEWDPSISVLYL
ncbi:ECs1072 family phage-associated protein [Providencia rettgeri]|uniref:ECs1072 family phage-associated protein n=1 Tax=Providencia rettgeri TaxID=587 RepID=UPI002361AB25|nr:hypothetical protein [Providencia rettgeri]